MVSFFNDAIIKSIICVAFFGKTYYSCGNETLKNMTLYYGSNRVFFSVWCLFGRKTFCLRLILMLDETKIRKQRTAFFKRGKGFSYLIGLSEKCLLLY